MANMAENWEQLSGKNNWEGLLRPLDLDLRKYIIQYGELAQATYDTFITEKASKYAGASRYSMESLFTKVGLDPLKYRVTKFFYATASIPLPDAFIVKSLSREAWSKESNFMGYIAVATDEGKVALGRRDIVVNWRGTMQKLEWVNDLQFLAVPGPKVFGDGGLLSLLQPLVHHGFYNIYTTEDPRSQFNQVSARDQVIEEVKRLVEEYKNEEVSITVTGHSLGASLATLNAVDIAFNGINKTSEGKEFPVTAFVFASPKVGDLNFHKAFSKLNNLHILRIHNVLDIVPKYPPIGYIDVGEELMIDTTKSPYVKPPGEVVSWHLLEPYLHGVAGTQGIGILAGFKLEVNRDISLVNKQWDILKDEYCIPGLWWADKHKGMVQQQDGSWLLLDREEYDF
ncbi:phospholipase A1-IIgamma isoform X1 [Nicotiana tabacum]|uniref:Phospholipase A1 n=2 Tax=Nicotiana TaxID=4085 RepID=A0A1S4DQY9_TOBAC|nr:PREDICTED: phospholipase A1-IIgamma-like isoform X1 [Nicotiana sylvestris]XP_016515837.1 PREDICTED: phospholipase A1-IIgamma-like isoform X1 [Nicotiana tabacum]